MTPLILRIDTDSPPKRGTKLTEKTPESYAVQANPYVGSVMLNIRGGTVGEFRGNLGEVAEHAVEISDNLATITAAGTANEVLNHAKSAASVTNAQRSPNTPPPPQAPPVAAPAGPAPQCGHGERIFETFTAKSSGKLMKKWVCPLKKADWKNPAGCADQWA